MYIKPSLFRILDNPDRNMKNEKFCSQLGTYFKRHVKFRSKRDMGARGLSDCVEGSWGG
jgi:DNA primase catalytic subunit